MSCRPTFSGITAFDRHRRAGACLSPLTIGLHADRRGVWRCPGPDDTKRSAWPQRPAHHASLAETKEP